MQEALGSIPGSGRSPGGGNGNRFQYSCLENPMNRGAWHAIVHEVAEESDMTGWLNNSNGEASLLSSDDCEVDFQFLCSPGSLAKDFPRKPRCLGLRYEPRHCMHRAFFLFSIPRLNSNPCSPLPHLWQGRGLPSYSWYQPLCIPQSCYPIPLLVSHIPVELQGQDQLFLDFFCMGFLNQSFNFSGSYFLFFPGSAFCFSRNLSISSRLSILLVYICL